MRALVPSVMPAFVGCYVGIRYVLSVRVAEIWVVVVLDVGVGRPANLNVGSGVGNSLSLLMGA